MNGLTLSINPLYLCNFRCDFCYLSKDQLGDKKIINIEVLVQKLSDITAVRTIEHVDLYGGEISLLSETQFVDIMSAIKFFYSGKVNIITNYYKSPNYFMRDDVELSVSWDSVARERHDIVYQNMLNSSKDIHVLMLASPKLLALSASDIQELIDKLNEIPKLVSLEIKPYSQSFFNNSQTHFSDHEIFVQKWIDQRHFLKFDLINLSKIKDSLLKKYSSWSDSHLYITPDADLAVLDFDRFGREYFKKIKDMQEYELWCLEEKEKISTNTFCGQCEYLGHCLSEHLQVVRENTNSCNGFYNLLKKNSSLVMGAV